MSAVGDAYAAAVQRGQQAIAEAQQLRLRAERAEAKLERLVAVHGRYFDLDGTPGFDDTEPEPEDVWRYDRDFRAALAGPKQETEVVDLVSALRATVDAAKNRREGAG